MLASSIPPKFTVPFGNNAGPGFIRTIPLGSQIGITDGAASLNDGFVPLNMLPVSAGGVPPFGQDMNGVLKQITQWDQWTATGGAPQFDAAFASAIGGYPLGAVVESSTPGYLYLSIVDNNTVNPNVNLTGWVYLLTNVNFAATTNANTTNLINSEVPTLIYQTGASKSLVPYISAGTFTVPGGVYWIFVTVVGGGGGAAGGSSTQGGGGGGGGGTAYGWIATSPGAQYAVTVGGGGAGFNNLSGSGIGNQGGTSSFGGIISATGGGGGAINFGAAASSGGPGGVGLGGQLALLGGFGTDGYIFANTYGGNGGASSQGGGGRSSTVAAGVENGQSFGSGAGGGYAGNITGGAGQGGIVIVQY